MKSIRLRAFALLAFGILAAPVGAQAPDPATRLRQVLPPDVASRVIAQAAEANRHHLPGRALEERALKFAARGVPADKIEQAVAAQAARMAEVQGVLRGARAQAPSSDEIEAGAEALREGVASADIATLAKSAPSGRSLTVPLFVIGSLTTRGEPASEALQTVLARLQSRASDSDLERLPDEATARAGVDAQRSADSRDADAAAGGRAATEHPIVRPAPHISHPVGRRPGRP